MTKKEFQRLKKGDYVYPIAGVLEGHAFRVTSSFGNTVIAELCRMYENKWTPEDGVQCTQIYESGYIKRLSYKRWTKYVKNYW